MRNTWAQGEAPHRGEASVLCPTRRTRSRPRRSFWNPEPESAIQRRQVPSLPPELNHRRPKLKGSEAIPNRRCLLLPFHSPSFPFPHQSYFYLLFPLLFCG